MKAINESTAAEEQDESIDESEVTDPALLQAAQEAMLKRTTDRNASSAELEMEGLLSLHPKQFETEMCERFGEAVFQEGRSILIENKSVMTDEDGD